MVIQIRGRRFPVKNYNSGDRGRMSQVINDNSGDRDTFPATNDNSGDTNIFNNMVTKGLEEGFRS